VKIGPVYSFGGEQPNGNCVACSRRAQRISSNISGCSGPIFAIFSPYESALRADDGSVPYFEICQGTLLWQQNNIAVMKAN